MARMMPARRGDGGEDSQAAGTLQNKDPAAAEALRTLLPESYKEP